MGEIDPVRLFDTGLYDPKTKSIDVQRWLRDEAYLKDNDTITIMDPITVMIMTIITQRCEPPRRIHYSILHDPGRPHRLGGLCRLGPYYDRAARRKTAAD